MIFNNECKLLISKIFVDIGWFVIDKNREIIWCFGGLSKSVFMLGVIMLLFNLY